MRTPEEVWESWLDRLPGVIEEDREVYIPLIAALIEEVRNEGAGSPERMKPIWDIVRVVEEECGNQDGRIFSSVKQIVCATIKKLRTERDDALNALEECREGRRDYD